MLIREGKIKLKCILIIVILVAIVAGGIFGYFYWQQTKEEENGKKSTNGVGETEEELAVYASLLEGYAAELIVITDKTGLDIVSGEEELDETLDYVKQGMPELEQETIDDFKNKNKESYSLKEDMDIGVDYLLISEEEIENIFQSATGWDDFYEKYPNSQGTMTLSKVGFNSEKDQALVYVGNQSHWLAGAGYYVLLVKENGDWIVKESIMTWIS